MRLVFPCGISAEFRDGVEVYTLCQKFRERLLDLMIQRRDISMGTGPATSSNCCPLLLDFEHHGEETKELDSKSPLGKILRTEELELFWAFSKKLEMIMPENQVNSVVD